MQKLSAKLLFFSIAFLWGFSNLTAQDITNNTFGKGLNVIAKDSSMSMKFGLRLSTLYEGYFESETKSYNDNIL